MAYELDLHEVIGDSPMVREKGFRGALAWMRSEEHAA